MSDDEENTTPNVLPFEFEDLTKTEQASTFTPEELAVFLATHLSAGGTVMVRRSPSSGVLTLAVGAPGQYITAAFVEAMSMAIQTPEPIEGVPNIVQGLCAMAETMHEATKRFFLDNADAEGSSDDDDTD